MVGVTVPLPASSFPEYDPSLPWAVRAGQQARDAAALARQQPSPFYTVARSAVLGALNFGTQFGEGLAGGPSKPTTTKSTPATNPSGSVTNAQARMSLAKPGVLDGPAAAPTSPYAPPNTLYQNALRSLPGYQGGIPLAVGKMMAEVTPPATPKPRSANDVAGDYLLSIYGPRLMQSVQAHNEAATDAWLAKIAAMRNPNALTLPNYPAEPQ